MNIAQAQKEIDNLRKQREEIYATQIMPIETKIKAHKKFIKDNCNHPEELILVSEVGHEDEYGKFVEGWTTLDIECTVCKSNRIVSKHRFCESGLGYSDVLKMNDSEIVEVLG